LTEISLSESGSELVFKCSKCPKSGSSILLQEIINTPDDYVIENWPTININILNQLKIWMSIDLSEGNRKNINKVKSFFKTMKLKIVESLNKIEDQVLQNANYLGESRNILT
jgi:hypothetical protein